MPAIRFCLKLWEKVNDNSQQNGKKPLFRSLKRDILFNYVRNQYFVARVVFRQKQNPLEPSYHDQIQPHYYNIYKA